MDIKQKEYFERGFKTGRFKDELPGIEFKRGDVVTYTNDGGVEFPNKRVAALSFDNPLGKYGNCVYLEKDSYWSPVHPRNLKK